MKIKRLIATAAAILLVLNVRASAQCSELVSGLRGPNGTALTNQGNLLVAETGTTAPRSGRISIVDPNGNRRTLIDGLPTGAGDTGDPSGPNGLFIRGRTLYLAIGTGDEGLPGPVPGTAIPNPAVSSPIFSSVLALQFSAATEQNTTGVTLTAAHEQALANGQAVTLTSTGRDSITIRMIANFPDYVPFPLPNFPPNVQLSNPFHLVAVEDTLYVTDGGRNRVWQIDLETGGFSTLVTFPNIPNPLFGVPGLPPKPFLEAVPTGIAFFRGQLLVTLFRGAPFPTGTSTVEQVDPVTGTSTTLIAGRTAAIDVLPVKERGQSSYLVLQFASFGPFFGGPGLVLRFNAPAGPPTLVADCLAFPTSMTLDRKRSTLYVSEAEGRIVKLHFSADAAFASGLESTSLPGSVDLEDR